MKISLVVFSSMLTHSIILGLVHKNESGSRLKPRQYSDELVFNASDNGSPETKLLNTLVQVDQNYRDNVQQMAHINDCQSKLSLLRNELGAYAAHIEQNGNTNMLTSQLDDGYFNSNSNSNSNEPSDQRNYLAQDMEFVASMASYGQYELDALFALNKAMTKTASMNTIWSSMSSNEDVVATSSQMIKSVREKLVETLK